MRRIKVFDTDTSLKWINFELDGKHYSIHFRDNFIKGTNDVSVWEGDGKGYNQTKAKIESTYPDLKKRIKEIGLVLSTLLRIR